MAWSQANPPIPFGVGVRHGVARDLRTAKTQVIKLARLRPQTGCNVAQAFTPRQLREHKTAELVETGKMLDRMVAVVTGNTTTKRRQRQMLHKLPKNILVRVGHSDTPLKIWGNP